jgi:dTDP-4-dehydrorhamnose reductase
MRILVIGGTGLVGNALVRAWAARGAAVAAATYHCHPSPDFRQLDMQDEAAVRAALAETKPDIVAVPAANPHVDYCELHPEETRRVNVAGTLNVARAAADAGSRMIFFSSDYVFDGQKGVYKEEDEVCPINEYGRQKAEAEAGVMAAGPKNLVVRTSGAYGWQWEPKNFVLQIKAKLSAGERMRMAGDLEYNPTAAENLAQVVVELARIEASGIFHVVGSTRLSRYAFAVKAASQFGLDPALLEAVPNASFSSPTPRPKSSSLLTDKVRAAVKTPLWGVDEGLARMKAEEGTWRAYAKRLPALSSIKGK